MVYIWEKESGMKNLIIDDAFVTDSHQPVVISGLLARFSALAIDVIFLTVITIPIQYFNITLWKNVPLLLATSIFSVVYKPFFEYNFGATIGKMAMNLKILNYKFQRAKLSRILIRNVIYLIPNILSSLITFLVFNRPDFSNMYSLLDYIELMKDSGMLTAFNRTIFLVSILDGLFVLFSKKHRALHDLLGGTIVVRSEK